nr:hypothetical protein [Mucilaginibacter sp. X4EP1]
MLLFYKRESIRQETTVSYTSEVVRDYVREDNKSADIGALLHKWKIAYSGIGMGVDYADYMVKSYPTYKGFAQ